MIVRRAVFLVGGVSLMWGSSRVLLFHLSITCFLIAADAVWNQTSRISHYSLKKHLMGNLSECVPRASSVPLTMFPLKSMLGNFLLMYLMADSMPLSVSRGRRVFGSAQVYDKRHHSDVYWMMKSNFVLFHSPNNNLPFDLGSAIRTTLAWLFLFWHV